MFIFMRKIKAKSQKLKVKSLMVERCNSLKCILKEAERSRIHIVVKLNALNLKLTTI